MVTTGEIVERAGKALYGENFKSELARALGVSVGRVDDWCKNRGNVPPDGVWLEVQTMLKDRQEEGRAALATVVERASITTVSLTFQQISNKIGCTAPWGDEDFLADLSRMLSKHANVNRMGDATIRAETGRYVIQVAKKLDRAQVSLLEAWFVPSVVEALRKRTRVGG